MSLQRGAIDTEAAVTLLCSMCKTLQAELYPIRVSGPGDIIMCSHVVDCVVRIYRVVADRPDDAPVGCAV